MRALLTMLAGIVIAVPAAAQSAAPVPASNQAFFQSLDLPAANDLRTGAGEPGPAYWQNRADYHIRATLDTVRHGVTGSETIHYINNSPDSLDYLWLQLDQNLFRPGSRGSLVNGGGTRWRGSFSGGGDALSKVQVVMGGKAITPETIVDGTRLRIDLPQPLAPNGASLDVNIDWSFLVPEYGADRMGRFHGQDGWVYEIAQWYPRMYVYDDVRGWNPMPYLGQGEFYLEYGDFDVSLTVPHDLIVVATGALQNPDDVLTAGERRSLEKARTSDKTVTIIGKDDVGKADTRPGGNAPLTWHFQAKHVRDVTWAASRAFIWDAAGWQGILLQSVYPREGLGTKDSPGWENSTQYVRHTISYYSTQWFHYPYPVATNVAGVVGGMEYPMIVFCSVRSRGRGLFGVTDHELGHSWFPMIVGSDERRYPWMDEGFNTFINHYSNLDFYGAGARVRTQPGAIARQELSPANDQPSMTYPDVLARERLGFAEYSKPAYGLIMLREVVLGHKLFDSAFRAYIRRWAFKHPKPADFFRTMNDVSGTDLDWFWHEWFYTTDVLDQAVDSVTYDSTGSHIALSNRGGLVMPVVLEITDADGSSNTVQVPVQVWGASDRYTLDVAGHVTAVTVDPDSVYPDVDRSNNSWSEGGGSGG
ncbi:MAG TPA: M1 family metallopeptidase [Longimicrobiales bacterium]|nr:M1 family metallopeptidase [Longimicrobiales bacterium]